MKMMKKKKKRGNKEKMTILMKMKNNFISPGNPKIKSRARSENMQESSDPKLRLESN